MTALVKTPTSYMTLGAYRLHPDGTRTTIRPVAPVRPATVPVVSELWPACRCPRHRGEAAR